MSAFVFTVDGSHLSINLKTSDLFCGRRYSALSVDRFFNFRNISKHVDLCYEIFILGKMLKLICLIEISKNYILLQV